MEKAKQAVSSFMAKAGHHDTTVHETMAPAVTKETVNPTRHEQVQTAVDKEVHQDHHHTTIQPVHDEEVLPEKHHHNIIPVEHKTHHHNNKQDDARRLEQQAAAFKDESRTAPVKETHEANPIVAGEHVHHHVHDTVQPVIHRKVIQPEVVHTTVPIHEVHHNAAEHHDTTTLPAVSLAEFQKKGGVVDGRSELQDGFDGCPKFSNHSVPGHHSHGHHNHGHTGGVLGNGDARDNNIAGNPGGMVGTAPAAGDRSNTVDGNTSI